MRHRVREFPDHHHYTRADREELDRWSARAPVDAVVHKRTKSRRAVGDHPCGPSKSARVVSGPTFSTPGLILKKIDRNPVISIIAA